MTSVVPFRPQLNLGFSPCALLLFQVGRTAPVFLWRVYQTSFHWVIFDVYTMQPKALLIGDAHVRKPSLPHLAWKSKFLFGAIRKAAFDQLHGLLDAHLAWNGHENVNMIWHDDKVVNDELLGLT